MVLDMEPTMPKRQWSYIIYFTAAFNCLGGLVFVLFASAEPQNWGQSKNHSEDYNNRSLSKKEQEALPSDVEQYDYKGKYIKQNDLY